MEQRERLTVDLIETLEACRLESYLDSVKLWTIGYGTTIYDDGKRVKCGDKITLEQAKYYLNSHLQSEVYPAVDELSELNGDTTPDRVYAAVASFFYNVGASHKDDDDMREYFSNSDWGTFDPKTLITTGLASKLIKYDKIRKDGILVFCKGLRNRRISEINFMLGKKQ